MSTDLTLDALDSALKLAIDAGDTTQESVARVNIASALLQMESPQALPAFEEALAAVRRAQNSRSEALLSMAFAPFFVDQGDPGRALELARRAEEIARRGRRGHRVMSLIQLARVFYTGFADPEQAGSAVDLALEALAKGKIPETIDEQMILRWAAEAGKAALAAGDTEHAVALLRLINPEIDQELEQFRNRPAAAALDPAQRKELEQLYRKWQTRFTGRANQRVAEMAEKTEGMLRWDESRARRSGSSGDAGAVRTLVERIYQLSQTGPDGMPAAAPPKLTDDDLVFAIGLAADSGFNQLLAGWAVFELVGRVAKDPALAGRCLRLAAATGGPGRDPRQQQVLYELAEQRLAGGADDALRAEVANEMAVAWLNLRQAAPALQAAQRAAELAKKSGAGQLERFARGNVANAYLGMQRVADALKIFEVLLRDQVAVGERDMAQVTRQNIEACRALLGRQGRS